MNCSDILESWCQGSLENLEQLDFLLTEELANSTPVNVWGITRENALEKIRERSQLFRVVQKDVRQLCQDLGLKQSHQILLMLWKLWLPLSWQLFQEKQNLKKPLIQGILGGQGTGKTTLAKISRLILGHLGCVTINLSLDDFYKTYVERQQLQAIDPRLIWRGPPGTHDIQLAIEVLDKFCQKAETETVLVPRFDKSLWNGAGDRTGFEAIEKADIILFEGWFVGVIPVEEKLFNDPPEPIITEADRQFAKDMNQELKTYLPLWQKLDRLLVMLPINYQYSKQWRREAEQKMIASGKTGMGEQEIDQFVEYFWRSLHPELFINPLIKNSQLVDLVIKIKADHSLETIQTITK
ncbi:MAG TPA: glycerate kinase [Cyanothece sp. UBA12306]|nr:glycerate kinase [Cyanothece sp. UBA12306]